MQHPKASPSTSWLSWKAHSAGSHTNTGATTLKTGYTSMAPPARCPPSTGPRASGRAGQHPPHFFAAPATAVRPPSSTSTGTASGGNPATPTTTATTDRNAHSPATDGTEYNIHRTPVTPPPPPLPSPARYQVGIQWIGPPCGTTSQLKFSRPAIFQLDPQKDTLWGACTRVVLRKWSSSTDKHIYCTTSHVHLGYSVVIIMRSATIFSRSTTTRQKRVWMPPCEFRNSRARPSLRCAPFKYSW
jgi:hypothetical protein